MELMAAAITITAISAIWLIDCLILWPKLRLLVLLLLQLALMSKINININIDPGAVCPAADVAALPNMFLWHFWPIGRQSSPSAVGQLNAADANVAHSQ